MERRGSGSPTSISARTMPLEVHPSPDVTRIRHTEILGAAAAAEDWIDSCGALRLSDRQSSPKRGSPLRESNSPLREERFGRTMNASVPSGRADSPLRRLAKLEETGVGAGVLLKRSPHLGVESPGISPGTGISGMMGISSTSSPILVNGPPLASSLSSPLAMPEARSSSPIYVESNGARSRRRLISAPLEWIYSHMSSSAPASVAHSVNSSAHSSRRPSSLFSSRRGSALFSSSSSRRASASSSATASTPCKGDVPPPPPLPPPVNLSEAAALAAASPSRKRPTSWKLA